MIDTPILPATQSTTKLFVSGPFGSGKTTLAITRIQWLLRQERTRGDDIVVLVPQRTLAEPYYQALRGAQTPPGPPVVITTFAGLAQQSVERYWPLLAQTVGFADPAREPTFLTLETSQYHMAQLVDAAIDAGEFEALRIDRSRVISQILDNLNKAALMGIEIGPTYRRLELAVPPGEQYVARINALRAAERISHAFRARCLHETLVDFSLMVVLFNDYILSNNWSRTHLLRSHRHLIFDNIEEDTPSAHRLALTWLPQLDSALLLSDDDAGYRTFLGADPQGVPELSAACAERIHLTQSYVMPSPVANLIPRVERVIGAPRLTNTPALADGPLLGARAIDPEANPFAEAAIEELPTLRAAPDDMPFVIPDPFRFYPQMLRWTAAEIRNLVVDQAVAPGDIAVMAPFVSDALRFSLQTALESYGIRLSTHRPSRPLEAEPATRTLLTLAKLAHPQWGRLPAAADVSQTLALAIPRLDPVRAHLLTDIIYPPRRRVNEMGEFATLNEGMRTRITYTAGEDYDRLREWIYAYRNAGADLPLDQFFARLFGEILSQPNYGFHADRDAARVASQLVASSRKFRWAMDARGHGHGDASRPNPAELGRAYIDLAESGAIGALYVPGWRIPEDAIFLAPAYTFLLRNRAVRYQFWLDIGASGWWERLYQPLTHPFVLSQRWPTSAPWTDFDEFRTRQDTLRRLMLGLIRRTKDRIYLAMSDYSESGYEQRGPLLSLINRLLSQT